MLLHMLGLVETRAYHPGVAGFSVQNIKVFIGLFWTKFPQIFLHNFGNRLTV
jgi:hypothetical protein